MARKSISSTILLVLITQTNSQFFDFFGFQPIAQNPKFFENEFTTRRPKIETVKVNQEPQISWKNTTILFTYDGLERDDSRPVEAPKEKRRKQQATTRPPTLLPIFNYYSTTQKPVRKSTKVNRRTNTTTVKENTRKKITNDINKDKDIWNLDVDVTKNGQIGDWYERPVNNVPAYNKPYYETTTKSVYNNRVIYNNNDYTTKRPYYSRPGVKPVIVDDRPPITNKPPTRRPQTQRPYRPETERPYRPETERPYRIETERPYTQRPYTERPFRPDTQRPVTSRPTIPTPKPYIVNPIPTNAGAVVFPNEDEPPEVIRGPDEDYMSDAEKRRYIELAEKMCDKYKSLNTEKVAAIPLLPSPEPVSVNVSKCIPTQIPLVVGGKVVTINEFPHMALLGWVKIDGGGYSWKCGGSLISEQHVLTAAHCSYEERDNTVITGPPRVVQLGSSYLDDPGALVVRVGGIIRHPKYKFPRSYYDLAIIKLVQPVSFSEVIRPACLGVPPSVDEPIIATGWGKTEFGGDQSLELRSVSLPVWDMNRCHEILGTSRKMPQGPMSDSQMCAGERRGGKDTCQGDSGGPAQLQDGCTWRVVAVTSVGRSCGAPNTPGLYALVQRAFVAAAVFGTKNNQRRSGSQTTNNRATNIYGQQNDWYTTQGYKSNLRTTTTIKPYYNYNQNPKQDDYGQQNRRTTRTTESYYNQNQNDNGRQSNRRTTTTTESYNYNPPQNDYGRQNNNNQRTDNYNSNNRRVLDTDAVYYPQHYNQQRDADFNQAYNRPQNDFWGANNRPNTEENNRRYDDRYEDGRIWFT